MRQIWLTATSFRAKIAKGKITKFDLSKAEAVEGVIKVFTYENRPRTAWFDSSYKDEIAPPGSPFRPLYDENILYNMQPIALVVAEDFETARYAATLVRRRIRNRTAQTDLNEKREEAYVPKKRSGMSKLRRIRAATPKKRMTMPPSKRSRIHAAARTSQSDGNARFDRRLRSGRKVDDLR